MSVESYCLPIAATGYFSSLVKDYLAEAPALSPFYAYPASATGAALALKNRQAAAKVDRNLLVEVLTEQYANILPKGDAFYAQIEKLHKENCFTVVTAHQPNIFTGPLYVVYKILHTVSLCAALKNNHPEHEFVPVYYMGSEDADLDELGQFTVDGFVRKWDTQQTGAVGRMTVDGPFMALIESLKGQVGVLPHGAELLDLFAQAYTKGKPLQEAMLQLVHAMFGEWGVVVLVPDHPRLKKAFVPVLEKELFEQFSAPLVAKTLAAFPAQYKAQATGRDLNLFYLRDDRRERIEKTESGFSVAHSDWHFTAEEMRNELLLFPERFSPNVILRGVFQETILPNIAFVGGGGELAYWLELRAVFAAANTPFPQLVLRNSFLCMTQSQKKHWDELGLGVNDLFVQGPALVEKWMQQQGAVVHSLKTQQSTLHQFYQALAETAERVDPTLKPHVLALEAKAMKGLQALEKKSFRAEKKKSATSLARLERVQSQLFPQKSLQERTENLAGFYGRWGRTWLSQVLVASHAWEQDFSILVWPDQA
ncbi:MAG: bacillithiol biosynthesis cysteine-adding enzyme BshC [Sphingobacteriia bacterium]|nr:MAG: bacillithiol biosynthesis cysteine-adding enzyme BshC [Sphingobacteriia bacterium]